MGCVNVATFRNAFGRPGGRDSSPRDRAGRISCRLSSSRQTSRRTPSSPCGPTTAGRSERWGPIRTGGAGDGQPHLTSQGSVTLPPTAATVGHQRRQRRCLPSSRWPTTVASGSSDAHRPGRRPRAWPNMAGSCTCWPPASRRVTGFRLGDGGLEPVDGGEHARPAPTPTPPRSVSPPTGPHSSSPSGGRLIDAFPVGADGTLGAPRRWPRPGPTPYGFAITAGGTLVVTEAFGAQKGAAAASSYRVDGAASRRVTAVGGQRSQRDLLGGRHRRRPPRLHHQLRRRRRLPVRHRRRREPHPRRRHRRPHRRRPAGLRDEGLTADGSLLYAIDADRVRSPAGRSARTGRCRRSARGTACRRRRRPGRGLTAAGRASRPALPGHLHAHAGGASTSRGDHGVEEQSFLLVEGRAEGRVAGRLRAANFPVAAPTAC